MMKGAMKQLHFFLKRNVSILASAMKQKKISKPNFDCFIKSGLPQSSPFFVNNFALELTWSRKILS